MILLVRVLHGTAHGQEEAEARIDIQLPRIGGNGDRRAVHQLHHEVRPPIVGGAGVEDAGDARVIHGREHLSLGFESRDDAIGVEAAADELERNLAADGVGLPGAVDGAHPALAQHGHRLVGPDRREMAVRCRPGHDALGVRRQRGQRASGPQDRRGARVMGQQRRQFRRQGRILAREAVQLALPILGGERLQAQQLFLEACERRHGRHSSARPMTVPLRDLPPVRACLVMGRNEPPSGGLDMRTNVTGWEW